MSEPREKELKLSLESRSEYDALVTDDRFGDPLSTIVQENHYFDSADLVLARSGAIFRVRRFADGQLVLGFKAGFEDRERPGFFDSVEVESEIPSEVFEEAREHPGALIATGTPAAVAVDRRFAGISLEYLGALRTERRRRQVGELLVELDHVTFPGGDEGFELEIETSDPDGALRIMRAELERRSIPVRAQHQTKLEQFLRRTGRFAVIESFFGSSSPSDG